MDCCRPPLVSSFPMNLLSSFNGLLWLLVALVVLVFLQRTLHRQLGPLALADVAHHALHGHQLALCIHHPARGQLRPHRVARLVPDRELRTALGAVAGDPVHQALEHERVMLRRLSK